MKTPKGYLELPTELVRNENLSHSARGLLFLALSGQSQGIAVTLRWIVESSREGKDAIKRRLSELEKAGYVVCTIPAGAREYVWQFSTASSKK